MIFTVTIIVSRKLADEENGVDEFIERDITDVELFSLLLGGMNAEDGTVDVSNYRGYDIYAWRNLNVEHRPKWTARLVAFDSHKEVTVRAYSMLSLATAINVMIYDNRGE
jgi:hypothetical protein